MAFSTTLQHVEKPATATPTNNLPDAVLSMMILSMYGAQMSKKMVRKLKRKFFWTSLKLKAASFFKAKRDVSDRQLIYIIAGVAFILLLILAPITALVLALIFLILLLAGVI